MAGGDRGWERCVHAEGGDVLLFGEEAQEGSAYSGDLVADGAAQHGVGRLQGVQDAAQRGLLNLQLHDLRGQTCQSPEVRWKIHADHRADHGIAAIIRVMGGSAPRRRARRAGFR